jgi:hypothetical protein
MSETVVKPSGSAGTTGSAGCSVQPVATGTL